MLALKTFGPNLNGSYMTSFQYPKNGEWTERKYPKICESGYHVATSASNITDFMQQYRSRIWVVECRGKKDLDEHTSAFEQIRLVQEVKIDRETINKCKKLLGLKFSSWFNKKNQLNVIFNKINYLIENKALKLVTRAAKLLNIPLIVLKKDLLDRNASVIKGLKTKSKKR